MRVNSSSARRLYLRPGRIKKLLRFSEWGVKITLRLQNMEYIQEDNEEDGHAGEPEDEWFHGESPLLLWITA